MVVEKEGRGKLQVIGFELINVASDSGLLYMYQRPALTH
jgi:hypothetical protein